MKIGIVGLPNVGKSTLFKALTKIQVDINNYPFCTIEPNVGIVEVPDERVDNLTKISNSKKKIYTAIEFVDIAGIIEGASEGQGLGNKFLHNIREVDAIAQVVRAFESKNITHVRNEINPEKDIEIINTELILADMETVSNRIPKLEKEARGQNKEAIKQLKIVKELEKILNENSMAKIKEFIDSLGDDLELVKDLHLLSFKPTLYVINGDSDEKIPDEHKQNSVLLDIKTEEDLLELSDEEQQELQIKSHLSKLIKKSYKLLDLITFLTTGEDETRAWTTPTNSTAPRAGRAIHSDFETKFIRADIISYDKLMEAGSMSKAKEKNFVETVGKNYIVQDGDIIEFKI
ncbi:MAG: redox-regulated ATPase YchF [Candidatus Marinimicrobia bacterium]|nr:redox-regulated ATPase YchF [Candidatus Neomarinimicrobiota bacterium]